jgi:hypothetical protein
MRMASKKRKLPLPALKSDRELLYGRKNDGVTGALKPGVPGGAQPLPPIDAAGILNRLAEIRRQVPFLPEVPPKRADREGLMSDDSFAGMDVNDFEWLAVADGLSALSQELSEAIDTMQEKALRDALGIYYAAEDLIKDPAHVDEVMPHFEAMRRAYIDTYGSPPPKKEDVDKVVAELVKKRRSDRDR